MKSIRRRRYQLVAHEIEPKRQLLAEREQELQAALDAAAAAQRSATAAEQQAAQQQASFALTLRREREKMRAEHQAAVAKIWQQVGDAEMGDSTPGANQPTSASP